MIPYLLKVKLPKNNRQYLGYLKRELLRKCEKEKIECIIEFIDGRIIIFSTPEIIPYLKNLRNIISIHSVKIFEDYEALIKEIKNILRGKESFAVRANTKSLEEKIGEDIIKEMDIEVNLKEPKTEIQVEKRGKYFLLYEENIYLKREY